MTIFTALEHALLKLAQQWGPSSHLLDELKQMLADTPGIYEAIAADSPDAFAVAFKTFIHAECQKLTNPVLRFITEQAADAMTDAILKEVWQDAQAGKMAAAPPFGIGRFHPLQHLFARVVARGAVDRLVESGQVSAADAAIAVHHVSTLGTAVESMPVVQPMLAEMAAGDSGHPIRDAIAKAIEAIIANPQGFLALIQAIVKMFG